MEIRIGRLPGTLTALALNDGQTIRDALRMAGLSREDYELRVNSETVDENHVLTDGDTVLLVKKIRGNNDAIEVRIGKLPGTLQAIALEAGATIRDALAQAHLSREDFELRVGGETVDEDYELADGDTVLLVKKIRGNDGSVREEIVGRLICKAI